MNLLSLFVTYLTVPSEACVLKWSCRGSKEFVADYSKYKKTKALSVPFQFITFASDSRSALDK